MAQQPNQSCPAAIGDFPERDQQTSRLDEQRRREFLGFAAQETRNARQTVERELVQMGLQTGRQIFGVSWSSCFGLRHFGPATRTFFSSRGLFHPEDRTPSGAKCTSLNCFKYKRYNNYPDAHALKRGVNERQTALYQRTPGPPPATTRAALLAAYPAPEASSCQRTFIVLRQQKGGWEEVDQETREIVPAKPAAPQAAAAGALPLPPQMHKGCTRDGHAATTGLPG